MIKVSFTANKRQGQSTFRAVLDFFFPIGQRIRFEASSVLTVEKDGTRRINREFGTFRAFFWHYFNQIVSFPKRLIQENKLTLEQLKILFKDNPLGYRFWLQRGAIGFNAASDSGAKEATNSWSWTHTSTGSNLVMVQDISWYHNSDNITISSNTYNSVSLTHQISQARADNCWKASIYTLVNPSTGSNTVSITFSSNTYGKAGTQTFSGCNTTNPVDVTGSTTGTSTTPTKSVTTNYANSFLVDCYTSSWNTDSNAPTPGTGQTLNWENHSSTAGRDAGSSRKATTSTGNYTMSWTQTNSDPWAIVVIAIREASVSANSNFFMFFN